MKCERVATDEPSVHRVPPGRYYLGDPDFHMDAVGASSEYVRSYQEASHARLGAAALVDWGGYLFYHLNLSYHVNWDAVNCSLEFYSSQSALVLVQESFLQRFGEAVTSLEGGHWIDLLEETRFHKPDETTVLLEDSRGVLLHLQAWQPEVTHSMESIDSLGSTV